MRFRLGEDERLYETLKTEVYLRLLAHLPRAAISEAMRNIQKMEAMAYGEGIKQGMAVAALSKRRDLTPIVQHAAFYGDAGTPLRRVEEAQWPGAEQTDPWVQAEPVVFPPQTIAEAIAAYGPTLEPGASSERPTKPSKRLPPVPDDDDGEVDFEDERAALASPTVDTSRSVIDEDDDRPPQSPDLLDRIRSTIKSQLNDGWKPKGWPDLIMRLHLVMQIDASYLDLQLSGEQGRTVLDQCGLSNLVPGAGVIVDPEGTFLGVKT